MRLSDFERDTLKRAAVDCFGSGTQVRLFGSRTDDSRKGGDIDLLVEVPSSDPAAIASAHTRFLARVYSRLGEQKVDVLIDFPGRRFYPSIFETARRDGVVL